MAEPRGREKSAGEEKRGSFRARERGLRGTRGRRWSDRRVPSALAVCVFNFPGPFCMQISNVIYPGEAREKQERRVTEECTCGE